ncbi:MAG: tRNA pseudouridine(38-40) synthase TruA [Bdellovibrionota bacterium]
MPRIKFTVAYDGTDFCGWQRQNHGPKPSVCQTIQTGLEKIFDQKISLFASGRTDAGVHALNQVCHFDTNRPEERLKGFDLSRAMKTQLPSSIVVKKAWMAPEDFHSTLSPDKKTYRYLIYNADQQSAFLNRYTEWIRKPLDLEFLNSCSKYLLGNQDFKSFQSVGSDVSHTVRTIEKAEWSWRKDNIAQFTITGSGFLKQMVRNIVGTQLLFEKKGIAALKMKEIIELRDRKAAGPPAPAQGLFLIRVYYPLDLDNRCREL